MHPPDATYGNVDPVLLRTWLRRKYIEKAWYKAGISLDEKLGNSLKVAAAGDQAGTKATIVKLPPKTNTAASSNDFFLDDTGGGKASASSSSNSASNAPEDNSWDAFGSKGQNHFDATFGTTNAATVQPHAHTNVAQDALFTADFNNLNMRDSMVTVEHHVGGNVERGNTFQANFNPNSLHPSHSMNPNPLHPTHSMPPITSHYLDVSHPSAASVQPNISTGEPNLNLYRQTHVLDSYSHHSMYAGMNQPYPIVGRSQPNKDDHFSSLQNLTHTAPETVPVDSIGTAFDSLVSSTISSGLHTSVSDEIHEINSLLPNCTKPQQKLVLQYIRQLMQQSNNTYNHKEKKGNPFDF